MTDQTSRVRTSRPIWTGLRIRPRRSRARSRALWAQLTGLRHPDPLTAKVVLKTPSASLVPNLATHYLVIGSKSDLAKGDLGTQMNGTGPFKFKSYTRGVGIELERNPNYWVKDRPYLDGLKYAIVADVNTSFTDFLAGHFNRYYEVLPENVDRIAKETNGKAKAVSPLSTLRDEVFFNGTKKPYNDLRVRQAVSLAIDRQGAGQIVMGGQLRRRIHAARRVLGYLLRSTEEGSRLRQA